MSDQPIDNHYVSIPITTLLSEDWQALTPSARCVYLAILTRYDRINSLVDHVTSELVEASYFSLKTVTVCLGILIDKGFISIITKGGRWQHRSTYKLNLLYLNANLEEVPIVDQIKLPNGKGQIYFIGNTEQAIVKIGYSLRRVEDRLASLQTGCPYKLTVLKMISGRSQQGETMLHRQFSEYSLHGEWFVIEDKLAQYLQLLP